MELVSVIIPTYARNDMLSRAINSVCKQTYSNVEILVIDDNDADSEYRKKTEEVMMEYKDNERIRYIRNDKNLGGAKARNVGIKKAKGDFIAFLDDDDEYLPENIEKKINVFKQSTNTKLALVYSYVETITSTGKSIIAQNRFKGNCVYEQLFYNCIAATSQWVCKKSAIIEVGMFSDVPCKQDSVLMLKLLEFGFEIDYTPYILTRYYDYVGERISTNGKTIFGEIHYRNLGRKLYDRLSTEQILEVEYSFAKRLMVLYIKSKEYKNAYKALKVMFKINVVRSIKVTALYFIKILFKPFQMSIKG